MRRTLLQLNTRVGTRLLPGFVRKRLAAHPVVAWLLILAGAWLALAALSLPIAAASGWQRERECRAAGNFWDPWGRCFVTHEACTDPDGRQVPIGATFQAGCNTCTCLSYGSRCTGKLCYTTR
jgi:hypothetical protein